MGQTNRKKVNEPEWDMIDEREWYVSKVLPPEELKERWRKMNYIPKQPKQTTLFK